MKKSAFVATKPLQYINCTNIEDDNIKICILCKGFYDVDDFFSIIKKKSHYFDEFKMFKSKLRALLYVLFHQRKYGKLYLDSDYGLSVRFLLLFIFFTKVFTYEEGYASYNYLRHPVSIRDRVLLRITDFFKIQNWSGGSCRVIGMYLYDPFFFKQNIKLPEYNFLREFKHSFSECILNSPELNYLSRDVDFAQFCDKDILIYLSSWNISPRISELLRQYPTSCKVLKLHPHITHYDHDLDGEFDYVIPSNLIVEYLLFKLTDIAKSIHIIHHGSFALHYLESYKANKITQKLI